MFKRHPEQLSTTLRAFLRANRLETPLLQRRLIAAWPNVAGQTIAQRTTEISIKNQTLFVRLNTPALRADLTMKTSELVRKLNNTVGEMIITNIRFI